ncbi:MAG: cytochrome d ubiquinol oxidase subunit II [Syntrophorhabdales bacterium]|jgi:cytochrome d ubiquinol oxidase subunit II
MLETIWFLLWGILWAVYFMVGGFDLGVGILTPLLGRTDAEKRDILASIGPFWDGNEVWLITAGGVTFAAFPAAYATLFSALYTPLMVVLFALIIRAVSIELRDRREGAAWRALFTTGVFIGSLLPAILFGVAFANIFKGIPIDGEGVFHGNLVTLLNPYGLAGGLFFLVLFTTHGSLWIANRTEGGVREKAARTALFLWPILTLLAVLFLLLSAISTRLWDTYATSRLLFVIPLVAVLALFSMRFLIQRSRWGGALLASFAVILFSVLFGVVGLYPDLLPSTLNPAFSLSIHNAASSPRTLTVMLVVALIFVPLVILYQGWVYRFFLREDRT